MTATAVGATKHRLAYSIHHCNVPVTDLVRTKEWYERVFGMAPVDISRFVPDATTLLMNNGNFHLHFEKYPVVVVPVSDFEHRPGEHLFHTCIEVTDWDEFVGHLDEVGVAYKDFKQRPQDNSKSATITDPDGHELEVAWHGNRDW